MLFRSGQTTVTTDYLSKEGLGFVNNYIAAYNGETLDSKYVEIECILESEEEAKIIRNIAEITKYGYYKSGSGFVEASLDKVDIDSRQQSLSVDLSSENGITIFEKFAERVNKRVTLLSGVNIPAFNDIDKNFYSLQDDDDFEQVEVVGQVFDLALRKYISAVNGEEITEGYKYSPYNLQNRDEIVPRRTNLKASSSSKLLTTGTAKYLHGKEAINVKIGDTISYTMQVYNEGLDGDLSGYAKEITDYLPEGLEFIGLAEGTSNYTATSEVVDGITKVKITYTDDEVLKTRVGLLELVVRYILNSNADLSDYEDEMFYQEVTINCKVTEAGNGKILTNRAEITQDQAIDESGKNIEVNDKDSQPESLKVEELNLGKYYTDYKYGINDDYITYYPGIEGDGKNTTLEQDDTDFENIKVQANYKLQIEKVDSKDSKIKLSGVNFNVKETINGQTNEVVYGPTGTNGLTAEKEISIDPNYIDEKDIYEITEINLGENNYYKTTESIKLYVSKENKYQYNADEVIGNEIVKVIGISFSESEEAKDSATIEAILEDGSKVNIVATFKDNIITITIPNKKIIFDLALRKFITKVDAKEITNRIPEFKNENGVYSYKHTKEPIDVASNNKITYTLRVYNEGSLAGYANKIMDDIPEGLQFVPYTEGDNSINDIYKWKMYTEVKDETSIGDTINKITYNGKTYMETTKTDEAKLIVTEYLSKNNEKTSGENLIKAFNNLTMSQPAYKDIQVEFKVIYKSTKEEESNKVIINYAQITDDSDKDGNPVIDEDSTPNEWKDGEDDQDIEKVKVKYFDLALKKWVSKAIVTENGKETVTNTGHTGEENPEPVVKVDLKKSKIKDVVVKFEYQIKVTNEGQISGEVREISDYIPQGLRFIAKDNPNWKETEGKVTTDELSGTVLAPGESATVTIILTWINSEDNMGLKINIAEISKDYNDSDTPDKDSTPNNQKPGEDDIDDAPVMLTIRTGEAYLYIALTTSIIGIIGVGTILIRKFVM